MACTPQGDNVDPTVALLAPVDGAAVVLGTAVSIEGTSADNIGVTRIEVQINDDVRVAIPGSEWEYSWTPSAAGDYELTARAFDAAGNVGESETVTVTVSEPDPEVDEVAPLVAVTSPAEGAEVEVGSAVTITGTAADDVGVTQVDVLVDGALLNTTVPTAGVWSLDWTPTAEGVFEISARALDAAGNNGLADAVSVTAVTTPVSGSVGGVITRTPDVPVGGESVPVAEQAPVEPGDVFVVFKRGRPETRFGADTAGPASEGALTFNADGGFSVDGLTFDQVRAYPLDSGLSLYRAEGLTEAATRALVDQLRASSAVAEAFPNWILSTNAIPNDDWYPEQAWHYEQINMPDAWDIEDGHSNRVTVAVLDTGWYPHLDLDWGVGANLVNWDFNAGIPDPSEGDITDSRTIEGYSPHGTHVAGTIGALTDNEIGVAGINWNVELLPIKVLGGPNGSGNLSGIIEGAFWAAGDANPAYGAHVNLNPANVLNLSLGGALYERCPASIDGLFAQLSDAGVTIVVSAGNNGSPSDINFPASCPSVITVGATGPTGARAYYSNYGAFVDVMAPGGDDDYPHPVLAGAYAGVISTWYSGGAPGIGLSMGTSMAAPHVTGVVSLMLAQDPTLTPEQIRERLHNASHPLTQAECNVPTIGFEGQNVCGAGLLDAVAALNADTVTTPTAYAYAIAYEGEDVPEFGIGNLSSLELVAANKAVATTLPNGDFAYEFDSLAPGQYLIVGLELRDVESGISNVDRVGFVEAVEVIAGITEEVDVVVAPIYATLR